MVTKKIPLNQPKGYLNRHGNNGLLERIVHITNELKEIRQKLNKVGVLLGKIAEIEIETGRIRVVNQFSGNNGTDWILPTVEMAAIKEDLQIGMNVLYSYPNAGKTQESVKGIYFAAYLFQTPDIDLSQFVTHTELDAELANYYTGAFIEAEFVDNAELQTALDSEILDLTNLINRRISFAPGYFYANRFTQGSKGASAAISGQWYNSQVTLYCNGSPLPLTGTPVQDGGSTIGVNLTLAVNDACVIGTVMYFRIATTARIAINGVGGVTIGGVLNGSFLMPTKTQWLLTKTGASTWSLAEVSYDFIPFIGTNL